MRKLSVNEVIIASCDVMRISREAIERHDRRPAVVFARAMTMLALRRIVGLKLEAIGAELGGRHHATVLNGIRAAEEAVSASAQARAIFAEISRRATGNVELEQVAA
jgi:chromosomal replication initiation ATPase DnaA